MSARKKPARPRRSSRKVRPDPAWAGVTMHRGATATIDQPALPRCAVEMGCLCFAHANGVPASESCNASEVQSFIDYALDDAKRHGEESEPDHEVGDLQSLVYACWKNLDAKGRKAVIAEVSPFMWTPPTETEAAITDSARAMDGPTTTTCGRCGKEFTGTECDGPGYHP
jgi:hypothetical protein